MNLRKWNSFTSDALDIECRQLATAMVLSRVCGFPSLSAEVVTKSSSRVQSHSGLVHADPPLSAKGGGDETPAGRLCSAVTAEGRAKWRRRRRAREALCMPVFQRSDRQDSVLC